LWHEAAAEVKRQTSSFSLACPTPTSDGNRRKLAGELEATIVAGVPPATLATEWERLDAGARACRGQK
jgi:hypothetical protein